MKPLFKSDTARDTLVRWHHHFVSKIPAETRSMRVSTRFGETHVLAAGKEDGPRVVILHGALASSAHLMRELAPLLAHYRVFAVDIVGQSVMSAPHRLSTQNDDHGHWLAEVLDALGLDAVLLLGVSWGGFAALRFTTVAPHRVTKLALLVPAGVVKGSMVRGFVRMGWPMTRFLMKPTPARRDRFLTHILTTPDDEWRDYLGDAFTGYHLDFKVPRLATPDELAGFAGPALVVAADNDISFPGARLIARTRTLFKGPVETELLKDCNHSPPTTDAFRSWMAERIRTFFDAA
jgi:2-hydroxy-6-oxonona-2,4-dienedioate hydrolase